MSDVIKAEYFYVVIKTTDGQLMTYTEYPEQDIDAERKAVTSDVYDSSKQIVDEVEKGDLAARVAELVVQRLRPEAPKLSDSVLDALKKRGIDPESVKPDQ
jgi:hypothetical protein